MDSANINETKKRSPKLRFLIILLIVLLLIPISILTLFYNLNQTFKRNANEFLSKMPGAVGNYFANIPTEMERREKIQYLSEYYLRTRSKHCSRKNLYFKKR